MTGTSTIDRAGVAIALFLLAVAAIIAWDTSRLELSATYGMGPQAMPFLIAGGLAILAVGNLIIAIQGRMPRRDAGDPRAILLILGGLAILIALMALGGGFIPGTAILFATTAAAFGRRAFWTDLAIGLGLAFVIYLLFVKLLTLSLPEGPIEGLF